MKLEVLSAAALALSQLCSAYPPLALPGLDARADANPWQPVPAGGGESHHSAPLSIVIC